MGGFGTIPACAVGFRPSRTRSSHAHRRPVSRSSLRPQARRRPVAGHRASVRRDRRHPAERTLRASSRQRRAAGAESRGAGGRRPRQPLHAGREVPEGVARAGRRDAGTGGGALRLPPAVRGGGCESRASRLHGAGAARAVRQRLHPSPRGDDVGAQAGPAPAHAGLPRQPQPGLRALPRRRRRGAVAARRVGGRAASRRGGGPSRRHEPALAGHRRGGRGEGLGAHGAEAGVHRRRPPSLRDRLQLPGRGGGGLGGRAWWGSAARRSPGQLRAHDARRDGRSRTARPAHASAVRRAGDSAGVRTGAASGRQFHDAHVVAWPSGRRRRVVEHRARGGSGRPRPLHVWRPGVDARADHAGRQGPHGGARERARPGVAEARRGHPPPAGAGRTAPAG